MKADRLQPKHREWADPIYPAEGMVQFVAMVIRVSALLFVATLTMAATPPPPAVLTPYIHDGQFDPGDYGWFRGAFNDADPRQKAAYNDVLAWRDACAAPDAVAVREALARRGVVAAKIDRRMGSGVCASMSYAVPYHDPKESWATFQTALARARPIAQTVIWSAALAQAVADPDNPTDASLLVARPMTDQVLRQALNWGQGSIRGAPSLDPDTHAVVEAMLWSAIASRDHANTEWLKTLVAAKGWPTIGKLGYDATHYAWLLVQHADDDPVFQYDMLKLMEPLAAKDQVAKADFALLYDRVMLQIVGKQRYGSQTTCRGGQHVAFSLEDPAHVDALRGQMGLGTEQENLARIAKAYGPCPPDPGSASQSKH